MYSTQFEQVRNNIRHNLAFDDQINAKKQQNSRERTEKEIATISARKMESA